MSSQKIAKLNMLMRMIKNKINQIIFNKICKMINILINNFLTMLISQKKNKVFCQIKITIIIL